MEQRDGPSETPVMYLAHEHWSPRYENSFFTVRLDSVSLLTESPSSDVEIPAKSNHPAYYYRIDIYCAHSTRAVFRRYSQFRWLYQRLRACPPAGIGSEELVLPPGTCFCQPQTESFAQNRLEQLREFIRDLLQRPGYSTQPDVVRFLELNSISA